MTKQQRQLAATYRDFVNNYLTVDKFAEHNNMDKTYALNLLVKGSKYHQKECYEINEGNKVK
jgi:hypothetical protein